MFLRQVTVFFFLFLSLSSLLYRLQIRTLVVRDSRNGLAYDANDKRRNFTSTISSSPMSRVTRVYRMFRSNTILYNIISIKFFSRRNEKYWWYIKDVRSVIASIARQRYMYMLLTPRFHSALYTYNWIRYHELGSVIIFWNDFDRRYINLFITFFKLPLSSKICIDFVQCWNK